MKLFLPIIFLLAPKFVYRDFSMQARDDSHGWFLTRDTAETVAELHAKIIWHEDCQIHLHGTVSWSLSKDDDQSWCMSKRNGRDEVVWMCSATVYGNCRVAFEAEDE